eukprot:1188301-Prorocentrum_minimum.AAC.2
MLRKYHVILRNISRAHLLVDAMRVMRVVTLGVHVVVGGEGGHGGGWLGEGVLAPVGVGQRLVRGEALARVVGEKLVKQVVAQGRQAGEALLQVVVPAETPK